MPSVGSMLGQVTGDPSRGAEAADDVGAGAAPWTDTVAGDWTAWAATGVENVQAARGLEVAAAGLLVVFAALVLISLMLTVLPWIVRGLSRIAGYRDPSASPTASATETEVAVAIAVAYAKRRAGRSHVPQ